MKLSKRAWNNVLIFSVLAMILLFNGASWLQQRPVAAPEQLTLVAEDAMLVELDMGALKVERIGRGWRYAKGQSPLPAEHWPAQYQGLSLRAFSGVSPANPATVKLWLAGEQAPRELGLSQHPDGVIVILPQGLYLAANRQLSEFVSL